MNPYLYLIPKGKNGFYYEPEIKEVVEKYSALGVDLSSPTVVNNLVNEIGQRIREIPFETVAIDEPPVGHLKSLHDGARAFQDGSTLRTMHDDTSDA